jgi:hypothetical protein
MPTSIGKRVPLWKTLDELGPKKCLSGQDALSWFMERFLEKTGKNLFWRRGAVKQDWVGMLHLSLRQHYLRQVLGV